MSIRGWYSKYTYYADESMEIHWVFTLQSSLLPLVCNKLANFKNSANFFKLWAKKMYKLCKMSFSECTVGTFDEVMMMMFNLWAKQWTQMTKGATFSLNCKVTYDLWPWNILLPSHLMLISLPTSSSNPNPPYSTKHFNIKEKMLSVVANIPISCTQRRIKILFHCSITYMWIKSHWVLLIVVTSLAKTTMKETKQKVILVESKRMSCIIFAIA